jgi:Large polyvalent protein associated domain 29
MQAQQTTPLPDDAYKAVIKAIKTELKTTFPWMKFSARLKRSGWMKLVQIDWVDGPTQREMRELLSPKYDSSHFDGMDDCTKLIPGRVDNGIEWCTYSRDLDVTAKSIAKFLATNFIRWRVCAPAEFQEFFHTMRSKEITWDACDEGDQGLLIHWVAEKSERCPVLSSLYHDTLEF